MKKNIALLNLAILLILFSNSLHAQEDALHQKHFNTEKGIMLNGYDPVSYYLGKPAKGKGALQVKHKGVTYQFSTQANLDKFKLDPTRYEPAYGGWCAYAMGAKAEKVEVDPETYKIINGKLYLFYNSFFNNTLTDWNEDETNLKKKADTNWSTILK